MKRKQVKNLTDMEVDQLVKIQGTQYDRKRKLTDKDIKIIKKLISHGDSIDYIAAIFGVTEHTIKYNIDSEYRQHSINIRSGKHYGETTKDIIDRASYKRHLILKRKIKI